MLKKPLTREFLEEHYIRLGKTAPQIMEEFGLSAGKVNKRLQHFGIRKPAELKLKKGKAELKTKEALERMYFDEGLSIAQIGEKLDITTGAVTKLFQSRGIKISAKIRFERVRRNEELRQQNRQLKQLARYLKKEAERVRNRKGGYKFSEETKDIMRITRSRKASLEKRRTPNELTLRQTLLDVGAAFREQVTIEIYRNGIKLIVACCVDFLILGYKGQRPYRPTIIMADGGVHSLFPENIKRDDKQNENLLAGELVVGRICDKCVNKTNVEKLLQLAFSVKAPSLIRLHRPEEYRQYHPNKYVGNNGQTPVPQPEPMVCQERSPHQSMTMTVIGSPVDGVRVQPKHYAK